MSNGRQPVVFVVALVLLSSVGCAKKKPQLPIQAKAPAEPIAIPLPREISEASPPPPPPAPPPEAPKVEEPKPKPAKHHRHKPPQTPATNQSSAAASSSEKTTMAAAHAPTNPAGEPAADMAIAADVPSTELMQQKQTTAQLLEATEKTLNGLSRSLSHDEEVLLAQIRSYVAQSRKATTDGDFERAYNLATKAHLLSDALVKK